MIYLAPTVPHVRYSKSMHQTTPGVRARILATAQRIIVRDGAERLTVAHVAHEAGLSVGGLRYHFASKRDLLVGLVEQSVAGFDHALAAAGTSPGAKTRAYLTATLEDEGSDNEYAVGLIVAVAVDSTLLEPLREHFRRWQEMLDDDGIDPATATLVRLALDGWWLAMFGDFAPPRAEAAVAVRRLLEELVTRAENV